MSRPRAGAAASALLLTAAASVAACGSSSTHHTTTKAPTGASGALSSITVADEYNPDSAALDPTDEFSQNTGPQITADLAGTLFSYNRIGLDPDTSATLAKPLPDLATSATPSANGLVWTVHLRPKVRSQAGNPLTAEDVVYTIDRDVAAKEDADNLLSNSLAISTSDPVVATGPLTVAFHLSKPSAIFEQVLTLPYLGILDETTVQAHASAADPNATKWLESHSASFGPYEIATDDLPNKIVLTADPNYWQGPPKIAKATFVQISDDSTRLAAVLSGQVEVAASLATGDEKSLQSSSTVRPYIQKNLIIEELAAFRLKNSSVANPTFRRAISYAINRQQIASVVYDGLALPIDGCMPNLLYKSASWLASSEAADTAKAKSLLAQVPGSHAVTIGYVASDVGTAEPEVIRSDLEAAGVSVTLKPYSSFTTWETDFNNGVFGIGLSGFGPEVSNAGYLLVNLLSSSAASNISGYSNAQFDSDASAALASSGSAGTAAVGRACGLVEQDTPIVPLVTTEGLNAVSSKIKTVASSDYWFLLYNMG